MDNWVLCAPCLGMGYKGRYRRTSKGRVWKIEACRSCGGTGQREANARQRQHKHKPVKTP